MTRKKEETFHQVITKARAKGHSAEKNNPNRKSQNYQGEYAQKQLKGFAPNAGRGNSQPPSTQQRALEQEMSRNAQRTNAMVKHDIKQIPQEMVDENQRARDKKERERLLQQYTIGQAQNISAPPRNISALHQPIKFPIQQVQNTHNFVMNQTHGEGGFSPKKPINKARRQVAMSPSLNQEHPYVNYNQAEVEGLMSQKTLEQYKRQKANHTAKKQTDNEQLMINDQYDSGS